MTTLAIQRASDAIAAGRLGEEIVAVSVPSRKGDPVVVDRDEHPRATTLTPVRTGQWRLDYHAEQPRHADNRISLSDSLDSAGLPKLKIDFRMHDDEIESVVRAHELLDVDLKAANAGAFRAHPWSVTVAGEAEQTGTFALEDLLKPHALEERIYRFRCVEAWSMVIPWVGVPLGDVLKRFKPTSKAKYVELTTVYDPKQMPGQRERVLPWPYVEGLRIDEAMHPLALLAVGVYGREPPNQNGAPLRLVVPWKYGFKNVKAIVKIRFTERQPANTWAVATPSEYGFYANVNPAVDHPRWSQATERRIGEGFFAARHPTLPFNGYADQVAQLYRGMDLKRYF